MRTLARRIVTVASSLMLAVTVALWARGQWATDARWLDRIGGAGAEIRRWRAAAEGHRDSLRFLVGESVYRAEEAGRRGAVVALLGLRPGYAGSQAAPSAVSPMSRVGQRVSRAGFVWEAWDDGPRPTVSDAYPQFALPSFSQSHRARVVAVPWWFLTVVFAVAPGCAVWGRLRPRRPTPGYCVACDYDLRASPDPAGPYLATCPECGRAAGVMA